MSQIVDNLIAYRVLSMLVQPFKETKACALGIIDENGNILKKLRDLRTTEEKDAYTYLHRLVFNLKRLLNKLPGGDNKFKNMVAALVMIKEAYPNHMINVDENQLHKIIEAQEHNDTFFVIEELMVEEFMMIQEEMGAAAANAVGDGSAVSTDQPKIDPKKRKRFKFFTTDEHDKEGQAKSRKVASTL